MRPSQAAEKQVSVDADGFGGQVRISDCGTHETCASIIRDDEKEEVVKEVAVKEVAAKVVQPKPKPRKVVKTHPKPKTEQVVKQEVADTEVTDKPNPAKNKPFPRIPKTNPIRE